jgi:cytochrome c biogenesis protein
MTAPVTATDRTSEGPEPEGPFAMSPVELLRWAWRQLTSMRTALLLLLLVALGSVPGSVIPQSNIAPGDVAEFKELHPTLGPVYDKLGLFSVYDSPWFSAIYLLLMVSLVGCIVPRTAVYWRALRAPAPRTPRNLGRLPSCTSALTDEDPDVVLERAAAVLKRRRYKVSRRPGDSSVAGERGRLREAGNLLFHTSVIVVLLAFAYGQLFGFKGGSIVLVGKGFSNSLTQYDEFAPGSFYDPEDLVPLSFTVEDFQAEFLPDGPNQGQPTSFHADIDYRETPGAEEQDFRLEVNKPLVLDGVSVFLVGHGYAPIVTVEDGNGEVAYEGPVVFLPQDSTFQSFGVIKVHEAEPEQLAFDGMFFPTYSFDMDRGPFSVFPDAMNPAMSLLAYHGDLGMEDGSPQSVFELDTDDMAKFEKGDGRDFRLDLAPGKKIELPDGLGSIAFDGWQRWVKLQVSHTPGKGVALAGVVLALVGLMGSLFIRRRRAWVRVTSRDGRTYVEVAGLDRSTVGEGLDEEVRRLAASVVPSATLDTGRSTPDVTGADPEVER